MKTKTLKLSYVGGSLNGGNKFKMSINYDGNIVFVDFTNIVLQSSGTTANYNIEVDGVLITKGVVSGSRQASSTSIDNLINQGNTFWQVPNGSYSQQAVATFSFEDSIDVISVSFVSRSSLYPNSVILDSYTLLNESNNGVVFPTQKFYYILSDNKHYIIENEELKEAVMFEDILDFSLINNTIVEPLTNAKIVCYANKNLINTIVDEGNYQSEIDIGIDTPIFAITSIDVTNYAGYETQFANRYIYYSYQVSIDNTNWYYFNEETSTFELATDYTQACLATWTTTIPTEKWVEFIGDNKRLYYKFIKLNYIHNLVLNPYANITLEGTFLKRYLGQTPYINVGEGFIYLTSCTIGDSYLIQVIVDN